MTNFELTKRENEIVNLACACLSNQEIADNLGISKKGVENHLNNAYSKLNVTNRTQLFFATMPDFFKREIIPREVKIVKNPRSKKIRYMPTKDSLQNEVNHLKEQRLKAALIAASLIDYISSDYIKNELKTLMVALRP